ncbi:MAG: helix-turn-helix domain-containing protein [Mycobacterium sp.]
MALPREYTSQNCPIARSLEIVGERWTLLILRDAFYGVRRFSDFQAHLDIPKAVLAQRLSMLVQENVLQAEAGEYGLTRKGRALWPVLDSLANWGGEHYLTADYRRTFEHLDCGGRVTGGVCAACGERPEVADLITVAPRKTRVRRDDLVSTVLQRPHRMLEPVRPAAT